MHETHHREQAIFDSVLEIPPGERAAHLDRVCGTHAELRQRVESLLNACGGVSDYLEQPAVSGLANDRTIVLAEKCGDTIGRYKLLQQIGEGGCGVVYMADQEEPVRRRVALKVIKPAWTRRASLLGSRPNGRRWP
jgi:eukaryotic-like serine/threonine-protein kinase